MPIGEKLLKKWRKSRQANARRMRILKKTPKPDTYWAEKWGISVGYVRKLRSQTGNLRKSKFAAGTISGSLRIVKRIVLNCLLVECQKCKGIFEITRPTFIIGHSCLSCKTKETRDRLETGRLHHNGYDGVG